MTRVLERLAVLSSEQMEVDSAGGREQAVASVTAHVAAVVDFTLKNSNQVRHRRDALNIMDILIKKLKELKYEDEVNKLKAIYQTYAADLSKDSSHEIRAKLDDIKVQLK
ncbi:unnamed protein product [Plutella xylostella]|uniref:(diamondback moth) hypothetical protein n=1 Tax=Plutella xylostella TaxID=51655 RepID=A0A8S4EI17_PLUXY|nr:unnamed protein product [Plutella xylostella]